MLLGECDELSGIVAGIDLERPDGKAAGKAFPLIDDDRQLLRRGWLVDVPERPRRPTNEPSNDSPRIGGSVINRVAKPTLAPAVNGGVPTISCACAKLSLGGRAVDGPAETSRAYRVLPEAW